MTIKIADAVKSRQIDEAAANSLGLEVRILMENAGSAAASLASFMLRGSEGRITVFCGGGRNGADGLVAARHLLSAGYEVSVILLQDRTGKPMIAELKANLDALGAPETDRGDRIIIFNGDEGVKKAESASRSSSLIIDALLGTGIKGPAEGLILSAIRIINDSGRKVLSLDIPSGLPSDAGLEIGESVKADATICFATLKPGILSEPAATTAGKLYLSRIGIPEEILSIAEGELIDAGFAGNLIPRRMSWFHKGDMGKVAIIAGSLSMPGAAALCALGALKGGAGICELFVPEEAYSSVMSYGLIPECMIRPLPAAEGAFSGQLPDEAKEALLSKDAIVIGPGMGRGKGAKAIIKEAFGICAKKMVVDADALWFMDDYEQISKGFKGELILTPHSGEMARLMRKAPTTGTRVETARSCASLYKASVAYKGPFTVVASSGGAFRIVYAGNSAMATPGSGDVLAGLIGAIAARGADGYSAASCGAFVHALAGDLAAKKGFGSALASDIAASIPEAMEIVLKAADDKICERGLPYFEVKRAVRLEES